MSHPGGNPGNSYDPVISANGRYVAYASYRDDLVPQDTNSGIDVFVYDRARATTRLVSVFSDHLQGTSTSLAPSISADGTRIAFRRMWYPPRGAATRQPRGRGPGGSTSTTPAPERPCPLPSTATAAPSACRRRPRRT
ncbi:TolB family protein [Streptomyces nogalater]